MPPSPSDLRPAITATGWRTHRHTDRHTDISPTTATDRPTGCTACTILHSLASVFAAPPLAPARARHDFLIEDDVAVACFPLCLRRRHHHRRRCRARRAAPPFAPFKGQRRAPPSFRPSVPAPPDSSSGSPDHVPLLLSTGWFSG